MKTISIIFVLCNYLCDVDRKFNASNLLTMCFQAREINFMLIVVIDRLLSGKMLQSSSQNCHYKSATHLRLQ